MQEIPVKSWEECQAEFEKLEQYRGGLRKDNLTYISPILYRGQGNAKDWKLKTTLERYSNLNKISLYDYYIIISSVNPQIESFTEKDWNFPS